MILRLVSRGATNLKVTSLYKQTTRHLYKHQFSPNFNFFQIIRFNSIIEHDDPNDFQTETLLDKHLLIAHNGDPVLHRIRSCETNEEFLKLSREVVTKDQVIQLLLLHGRIRNRNEPTMLSDFNDLIKRIDRVYSEMNDKELALCLLYLRLLSVNTKMDTIQSIIGILLSHVKEKGVETDSIALSVFTEFLMLERSLYSKLIMVETLPVIFAKLERCEDTEEAFLLASCLNNIHPIISKDALEKIKLKTIDLLDRKIVNEEHPQVVFKLLNFFNFPYWSSFNSKLIQRLLLVLEKSVPKMTQRELIQTNRSIFSLYEPASLVPLIRDRAHELMNQTQNVELLQIICLYCTPEQRIKYVEMLKDKVLHFQTTLSPGSDSLPIFFKILRLLKISDIELCDCFWTKIVNKIFSLREVDLKYRIPKYFFRYLNFNNNLGGTYRHVEFEKIVTEYCIEEMKTGSSYLPKDFLKFASFVIAYSDQQDSIPNFIIEKLIIQQEQFDLFDCKILSRALEILYGFRIKNGNTSKVLDDQVEILQFIINNCTKRYLKDPNIHLKEMNTILSSFVRRRASKDSHVFHDIMKWYEKPNLEFNSRSIRELCHSLLVSKYAHDTVCDQFFDYIVQNSKIVTGETVEKVLTTCYGLSFFPENPEALDCCSEIIERDFNLMTGLSIVQALIALTFYKQVPYELVMRVFQGNFIKKLEQEIKMAYRHDTYPQKVMTLVMQLNRALCLDFPEYSIRWFQQNFIEAQMSKRPAIRNKFHEEVRQMLLKIVPGREFLAINRTTPYGYIIDFEINLDNFNKFFKPNQDFYDDANFKPKITKIAILLLGFDTFCYNDINRLRGSELLRMRHLEMMNYKVVHVKKSDFSILYENLTAKIKHMKKLLMLSG